MLICQANSLALNQVQSYEIMLLLGLFQRMFFSMIVIYVHLMYEISMNISQTMLNVTNGAMQMPIMKNRANPIPPIQ